MQDQPVTSSPDTAVDAVSVKCYTGQSAKELASQVRILHPDAIVVMPDWSVHSYQKYASRKMDSQYRRQFANVALNPSELSVKGIEAVIASGFYQNRAVLVARKNGVELDKNTVKRYYSELMSKCSREHEDDSLVNKAKAVVKHLHEQYPDFVESWDRSWESEDSLKALMAQRSLFRMLWPSREIKNAKTLNRNSVNDVHKKYGEGFAPPLTDSEREKIERFMRDKLAQMPVSFLKIFNALGYELWAADLVNLSPTRGFVHPNFQSIASQCDDSMALFEEFFHQVDLIIEGSSNPNFIAAVNGEGADAESLKAKQFVDDMICKLVGDKTPIFRKGSTYNVKMAKVKAMEFMVNLGHLDRVELSELRRAELGQMLHEYWPREFSGEPYQGTMRELLADRLPKTFPHYLHFLERAEIYANEFEAQSADKSVNKALITQ